LRKAGKMTEEPINEYTQQPASGGEQPISTSERARLVFYFVSEHFALLSSITLAISLLGTTLFLYGYLRVFDWRLIWIIEYPDVIKFGLVAFAIISVFAWQFETYVRDLPGWMTAKEWTTTQKVTLGITLATVIYFILHDEMSDRPYWAFHISIGLSIGAVAFIVWWLARQKTEGWTFT
jgi:hypothetical protein